MQRYISINLLIGFYIYIFILLIYIAPCEDVKCGTHAYCKPNGQEAYCMCEEGWTYNPNDLSLGCVGKIRRRIVLNWHLHLIYDLIYILTVNII